MQLNGSMETDLQQACPLCSRPAAYETVHDPYGKRFTCSTCTEFFIDGSTEQLIANMPAGAADEFRAKASKAAQRTPRGCLCIFREPIDTELGGDGRGVARATMVCKYEPLGGRRNS